MSKPPSGSADLPGTDGDVNSGTRLDRPVDVASEHVLGGPDAAVDIVEYGSYACPHCRVAHERMIRLRDHFGDRLRYVFRHRPLPGNDLARRAAELTELTRTPEDFWRAHDMLMCRSSALTETDLQEVAAELELPGEDSPEGQAEWRRARQRVDADERSARASSVHLIPSFFINGRKYEGAWDVSSFADAVRGGVGYRLNTAVVDFIRWGPAAGVMLLMATILAVIIANSPLGGTFENWWQQTFSLAIGDAAFGMPLLQWINDGLLTIFFLTVGLEIKREFTIGHLSDRQSATLPIAAAIGGMIVPALLYILIAPAGPLTRGWGIPIATDTAFAVAIIAALGARVSIELRVFLTAAAIVDDIVIIFIVAIFYSHGLHAGYLAAAAVTVVGLMLLNRWRIYRVLPYAVLGLCLWLFLFIGGLHATLAGVLLALTIPTRPPPNLRALMTQAGAIVEAESARGGTDNALRHRLSGPALNALDIVHRRLESPAQRMLKRVEPWSSYAVLPIFAFANAGVAITGNVWGGHAPLIAAIIAGLVLGKPAGLLLGSAIAVRLGIANRPSGCSWMQIAGACAFGGIGFTMSLFIAGQAFPVEVDFAAAKIAIFIASILAAVLGTVILLGARRTTHE